MSGLPGEGALWSVLRVLDGMFLAAADAAPWVLLGFALAGFIHGFVPPRLVQRLLGGNGFRSVLGAAGVGAVLPMCSCGVVPTAIGLHRTGAGLGPTITFMVATPAINPGSLLLAWALLGPRITALYAATAVFGAIVIGLVAGHFSTPPAPAVAAEVVALEPDEVPSLGARVWGAFRWGFGDLGVDVSYYILVGLLLTGVVGALIPRGIVESTLDSGPLTSLLYAGAVALPAYVCAVGSVPLVGVLLAKGAAPGVAIVLLMAGPATNLGELLAISARLGRRAALWFAGGVAAASLAGGLIANLWLGGLGFEALVSGGTTVPGLTPTVGPAPWCYTCVSPALWPLVFVLFALGLLGARKRLRAFRSGGRPAGPVRA
jgi:uncharacterized membrane protein YraQ (UPF0718 family)